MGVKRANADDHIWLRQAGEGEKAYEAFRCFLELGDERTVAAVGRILGKHRSHIDGWRSKFNWRERATAYDNHLTEAAANKARREIVARYENIGQNADELLNLGMSAVKKAKKITPRMGLDAIALGLRLAEANRALYVPNERERAHADLQLLRLEAAHTASEADTDNSNFNAALQAAADEVWNDDVSPSPPASGDALEDDQK